MSPQANRAAHDNIVARIGDIWSRTLRVSPIAPDANFFELGGDSLLAVGLFLEIERETGIHLPITTIYDAPTIAKLAKLLAGETAAAEFSPLVLLKPGEGAAPLFIMHGIGGTVMELSAIGRAIRIPSPVYALQAQGVDGKRPPLESIDEMSELYLDHVRGVQPEGPYWLFGYSFGGLVALEMARRLLHERQEIAALILMDAFAHPATWPRISRLKMRTRRAFHLAMRHLRTPVRESVPAIVARLGAIAHKRSDGTSRYRDWLLEQYPDLPLPLLRVREAGSTALSRYVPQHYPGKVIFLRAAIRGAEFPEPEPIWRPLVRDMALHTVPGGHRTMVSEHATSLAGQITACVLDASRRRAARTAGAIQITSTTTEPRLEPHPV
jgi:thioesterase domain-containing protein/acyl carrier protein